MRILDTAQRGERIYKLAETPIGKIVFYQFGEENKYTQYKNITNKDIWWTIKETSEFNQIFNDPLEIFASKRISGLKVIHKYNVDGE